MVFLWASSCLQLSPFLFKPIGRISVLYSVHRFICSSYLVCWITHSFLLPLFCFSFIMCYFGHALPRFQHCSLFTCLSFIIPLTPGSVMGIHHVLSLALSTPSPLQHISIKDCFSYLTVILVICKSSWYVYLILYRKGTLYRKRRTVICVKFTT